MGAEPLHSSPVEGRDTARDLLISGVEALHQRVLPQAFAFSDVIGSSSVTASDGIGILDYAEVVIVAPRRCSKTSSIQATLVGRMKAIPGYGIISTAQTGLKARARFFDVAIPLHKADPDTWPLWKAAGRECLEYAPTGARWDVVAPKGDKFRSEGADCVWVDEAQEFEDEAVVLDLQAGIDPTLDTSPYPQLIVSGTPSAKAGMLWDALQRGHEGDIGIVEYAAREDDDPDDEAVWHRVHPGIGTLTTIERMRERRRKLGRLLFGQEYLCLWQDPAATRLLSAGGWAAACRPEAPSRPERIGLAFEVALDGSYGAVMGAWRDGDGRAWWELLGLRSGAGWLPIFLGDLARRRHLPISYDAIGQNLQVAEALTRIRPRPRLDPLNTRQMIAACPPVFDELHGGRVLHVDQPDLATAIGAAAKRYMRDGGWVWNREAGGPAIAPLIAGTVALAAFDRLPAKVETRIQVRT
jgi:hypothetical protein